MKKFLHISLGLLLFISCEKQVIRPVSSSNSDLSTSDVVMTNDNQSMQNYNTYSLDEKSINGDLIIDPNGRDDVGTKKDKKSK